MLWKLCCMILNFEDYIQYGQGNNVEDRAKVELYLASAQSVIESYCNRQFEYDTRTITSQGTNTILLQAYPVTTAQVLQDNLSFTDYRIDMSSGIVFLGSYNPTSTYKVIYSGGFETIPFDLKLACHKLSNYYLRNTNPGIRSQVMGDIQTTYSEFAMPLEVRQILDFKYKG